MCESFDFTLIKNYATKMLKSNSPLTYKILDVCMLSLTHPKWHKSQTSSCLGMSLGINEYEMGLY